MQSFLMVLSLPPLLSAAAMYNGWKFRVFEWRRRGMRQAVADRAQRASEIL